MRHNTACYKYLRLLSFSKRNNYFVAVLAVFDERNAETAVLH